MNMNIYITKDNEERLKQEPSMSGLINKLLGEYYGAGGDIPKRKEPWNIIDLGPGEPVEKAQPAGTVDSPLPDGSFFDSTVGKWWNEEAQAYQKNKPT